MKRAKRIVSLLLSVAFIFSLCVPVAAVTSEFTAEDILVKVEGAEGNENLEMAWKMKASVISGTQYILLSFDAEKLVLLDYEGNRVTLSPSNGGALNNLAETGTYVTDPGALGDRGVTYTEMGCGENGRGYLYISVAPGSNSSEFVTEQNVVTWSFAFADGFSVEDLDSNTIKWVTASEADYFHQASAVNVHLNNTTYDAAWVDKDIGYNIASPALVYHFATDPVISYPNSNVRALNRVDVKLDKVSVNTPVELPEAGEDVKVASTVTAYDVSDTAFTAADNVSYTYSLAMKDNSPVSDKITVDSDGVIAVSAGAPEGTLVLTATASYTKTNGRVSTKTGTAELVLSHGNATTDAPTDPVPGPGEVDPDVEKKFSGVIIKKGEVVVVTSAEGSTYSETIGIPTGTDNNSASFEGTAVDQYGEPFDGITGTWDDSVTTGDAAVTVGNGTVTVTPAATSANFDYKFSASQDEKTYEATVSVTVSNTVVVWPTLTNGTIVYGQPISDFTFDDTDCSVADHGVDVSESASFAWTDAETTVLNAGTTKLEMTCSYNDKDGIPQTTTKDYAIKVNKADQVITIAQDGTTETTYVNVEIDLDTNLAPVVKNKTVDTATGMGALSYGPLSVTGLVTHDGNGIIHGDRLSVDANDVATMTLTAASNDNYNEATRTITFSVSNQILRAQIVFDKTTPVAGQSLKATVTESTDPLQDNSLFDENGAMYIGITHNWLRWSGVEGENPVEIEGAASTMAQPNASVEEIEVTYSPVAEDVGQYLILQINRPNLPGYAYIDLSSATTANKVIKFTPGKPSLTIQGKTTSTITITPVTGAEYALSPKTSAPTVIDETDGEETTAPTLAWQDSNEFTGLTPNTQYDAHIRLKETGTDNPSDYETLEVTTDAISIDPENPSTDPAVVFTTEPSVSITGDAKYGEELTAVLTDAVFTLDDEPQTGPFYTEYQWYRTTPAATEGEEATTEEISGATTDKYTLTQADIGKTITVKVTPAAASPFSGEVSATTAEVEKADGPEAPTGITNSKKATSATSADGELSGVTDTMEYRLKAAEGAEEAEWISVSDGATTITDLKAGTYEIRVKETDTTKAGAVAEVAVALNGHNITGNITSYNGAWAITYKLINENNEEITGTLEFEPLDDTAGQKTQAFTISAVPNGTYQLIFSKTSHLDYTVNNVVVQDSDLDLSVYVSSFEMGAGDINGDGSINAIDGNVVIRAANFGKSITAEGVTNPEANINGDSSINALDGNVIILAKYFGKGTTNFTSTISYNE